MQLVELTWKEAGASDDGLASSAPVPRTAPSVHCTWWSRYTISTKQFLRVIDTTFFICCASQAHAPTTVVSMTCCVYNASENGALRWIDDMGFVNCASITRVADARKPHICESAPHTVQFPRALWPSSYRKELQMEVYHNLPDGRTGGYPYVVVVALGWTMP